MAITSIAGPRQECPCRTRTRYGLCPLQTRRNLCSHGHGGSGRASKWQNKSRTRRLRARLWADHQSRRGARAQIEGCIIQTLSRALKEEVTFDRARVSSVDWSSYPILTFVEVPKLEVELIDRPTEPPLGAGEPACTPVGAALANAVYDATGLRLRTIPFTAQRVRAAWDGKSS